MSSPTRFPNGSGTVRSSDPLGMYGLQDPTKYHTFFTDFDKYAASDWVITVVEAGAGSASEALADADNGVLVITNDSADDDSVFMQWAGGAGNVIENYKFVSGEPLWFKTRFKISDATQSDMIMGLVFKTTTPLANTDGVYFTSADGSAAVSLVVNKNSTATTTSVTTMADDTYVELAFYYNGSDSITAYADGVAVASSAITNLPDDEELSLTFGLQNGAAASKVMTIDYVFVTKQRT